VPFVAVPFVAGQLVARQVIEFVERAAVALPVVP
jgi:hypothetical protein